MLSLSINHTIRATSKQKFIVKLTNPLPSWLPIWDYSYDGTNVDRSGSGASRPKVFYRKPDTDFLYVGEPLSCEKEMNQ